VTAFSFHQSARGLIGALKGIIGSDGQNRIGVVPAVTLSDSDGNPVNDASTYWNYAAAAGGIVNTTTAVTIKAAAGAGVRNYISSLNISHDALGAATEIVIRDGAAGTVIWRGKLQTTAAEDKAIIFNLPLRGSPNTLLEVATLTAVTGGVFVNVQGYTGA
jgi:hypothetical protein